MANEFNIQRTAKASFTLGNASTTHSSGVFIPAGAIVTGVRVIAPSALTVTANEATVQIRVGATNVCATTNVSVMPAVSVPTVSALATTDGNYITVDSQIQLVVGASISSTCSATYDYYVDYIYA